MHLTTRPNKLNPVGTSRTRQFEQQCLRDNLLYHHQELQYLTESRSKFKTILLLHVKMKLIPPEVTSS